MGQTGAIAAVGAIPLLLGAAVGGGIAWAGFSMASKSKGAAQIVGYLIGSIGALGALGGAIGALLWTTGVFAAKAVVDANEQRRAESMDHLQRITQEQAQPMVMPSAPSAPSIPSAPQMEMFQDPFFQ